MHTLPILRRSSRFAFVMPRFDISKIAKPEDARMDPKEARENDLIIPVMGPTGVGKSTSQLINHLLGDSATKRPEVSDGFKSCTSTVDHYFITIPQHISAQLGAGTDPRRLVLVDTPGFDDTNLSDSEILRRIAVWLASSYKSAQVAGVIYMYPIYPNRMTRNDRSNVKVFQQICGKTGLSKVILATTRWDICPTETGDKRELELQNTFWSDMIDPEQAGNKAVMQRLNPHENPDAAWDIITTVLKRMGSEDAEIDGVILHIQSQIVEKRKKMPQTDAAQELRRKLQELLNESGSSTSQARRERLRGLAKQIQELRIPLGLRIKGWFGM